MYPSASAPAREPLSFPTRRSSDLVGGSVVHPFSVQDAVHGGVLDGAHTVPVYWYGKHKAASLFGSGPVDRKSTRLNSSHGYISYAVFCLKKKQNTHIDHHHSQHVS